MKNTVELLGYYGSDLTHAQSAWTSTVRDLSDDKLNRIDKLLNMLASAGHHTPFEKSSLHFLVCTDIASHIHILKHRIGVSVNAESARYKELNEDKHYLPEDWEGIPISKEVYSGNSRFKMGSDSTWTEALGEYAKIGNNLYHQCVEDLTPTLGRKRAKESARFFKTYHSQIQADVQFNFRSFAHFLNLRNKPDAQLEIRDIAGTMLELVKNIKENPFQLTLEAFKL